MSQDRPLPPEFAEWIVRSLDGTIRAEEFAALDQLLATDERARSYYLELMATYVGLVDLAGSLPTPAGMMDAGGSVDPMPVAEGHAHPVGGDKGPLTFGPNLSEEERKRHIEAYARRQLESFLTEERQSAPPRPRRRPRPAPRYRFRNLALTLDLWCRRGERALRTTLRLAVAAVILVVLGLIVLSQRPVARIVESVDARWSSGIREDGLLPPRRFRLEQGYVRIAMHRGADLILQAPTTLKLETANRLFLETGWLTARVPTQAYGFTVVTPASNVVDFGTEFGVLVDTHSSSQVHVFEGEVGLSAAGGVRDADTLLTESRGATLALLGGMEQYGLADRTRLFARRLPDANSFATPGKRLDLADMLGGGNGLGTGVLGQGLDPSQGRIAPTPALINGLGRGYFAMPGLLFIDGVFVPDGGMGAPTISSTGLRFQGCPDTLGICRETITNGALFHSAPFQTHAGRLASSEAPTRGPALGMHPNAGLTFDLGRIRSTMADVSVRRFTARCGLSRTIGLFAPVEMSPPSVDVWILVDGEVRFSTTLVGTEGDGELIDLPLSANDRFLTLVTTTGTEDFSWAWAMFLEPALLLHSE